MRPLDFNQHEVLLSFVENQLQAYRVWRHFAFSPSGLVPRQYNYRDHTSGGIRRYLGFGRTQFRGLCEAISFSVGKGKMLTTTVYPRCACPQGPW